MNNSICYDCTSRFICVSSDVESELPVLVVPEVIFDDITNKVIDCNLYQKEI